MIQQPIDIFKNFTPVPASIPFLKSTARYVSAGCGSRSGKTLGGVGKGIGRIYEDVAAGKQVPIDDTHRRYWIVAPTYQLSRKTERTFRSFFRGDAANLWAGESRSERTIYLHPDIAVEIKSADRPLNLVSEGLFGVILDEGARMKEDAWLGQLYQRLSSYKGWAIAITTPLGRNWFYQEFVQKAIDGAKDYETFNWHTRDNIFIPDIEQEVADARENLPLPYYLREYEGSWDAYAGQIYTSWNESTHIISEEQFEKDYYPIKDYTGVTYGFDWGFRHPGLWLTKLEYPDGIGYYVNEIAAPGQTSEFWTKIAQEQVARWGYGKVFCSHERPDYKKAFRDAGIDARTAKNAINAGIELVAKRLHLAKQEDGTRRPAVMFSPECKTVRQQMPGYHWRENSRLEKPEEVDDDAPDTVRYIEYSPQFGARAL